MITTARPAFTVFIRGRPAVAWGWLAGALFTASVTQAGEPPPPVVAEFTRRVQPLVFNRCATGGCHGGPDAGSLHLVRRDFTGRITREITLANIEALLAACGPERSPAALIATISGRHPESAQTPRELAQPLSPRERALLEGWLTRALTAATFGSTTATAARPPSRFQKLLDEAANPPQLPQPQEPQGVILK
jgi:hypothetical protein